MIVAGMQHLAPSFAFLHQAHNNDETMKTMTTRTRIPAEREILQDRAIVGSL